MAGRYRFGAVDCTRWKLRVAINKVNETLAGLKLKRHPEKTFIGSGLEFLGYAFSPYGLEIARVVPEPPIWSITSLPGAV